jgi:hypothetical protein
VKSSLENKSNLFYSHWTLGDLFSMTTSSFHELPNFIQDYLISVAPGSETFETVYQNEIDFLKASRVTESAGAATTSSDKLEDSFENESDSSQISDEMQFLDEITESSEEELRTGKKKQEERGIARRNSKKYAYNRFYFHMLRYLQRISFPINRLSSSHMKSFYELFLKEMSLLSSNYNSSVTLPTSFKQVDPIVPHVQWELFRSLFSLQGFDKLALNKSTFNMILPELLSIIEMFLQLFPFNSSKSSWDLTTFSAGELLVLSNSFTVICDILQDRVMKDMICKKYLVDKRSITRTDSIIALLSKNTFDSTVFVNQLIFALIQTKANFNTAVNANFDLYYLLSRVSLLFLFIPFLLLFLCLFLSPLL